MITVVSQPPGIEDFAAPTAPPIPVSDCMNFCLLPDTADVFVSTGSKPTIVFTIPFTCTVPADGTAFTIWGYDFTVQSSTEFTSESFKVDTNGLFTAVYLSNMLAANIFFKRAMTLTSLTTGATSYELTFTWNECREQVNFTGSNMELTVFTTIGGSATATNGVSPVYVDGFRLLENAVRYNDATSDFNELGALVGMEIEKLCDTVGQVCIDIRTDVAADLYTLLPELTYSSFISSIDNGRSMMRYYTLQYGWTYRENCVAKSGTIKRADRILALNAAFDVDDPYQMRRYWYDHPDGYPPGQTVSDFLTTQPKTLPLCTDSFKWLWMLSSWQDDFGQYALIAKFVLYDSAGAVITTVQSVANDPLTMGWSQYQPVCINVSPRHISDVIGTPITNVAYYDVYVVGTNSIDYNDIWFTATETLRFEICKSCCTDATDLYFLSPAGGIDTMVVRVDSLETLQSGGEEIRVNIPCGTERTDRATYGGRSLVATRVYQKMKLSVELPRTSDWEKWAKHLRQSPQSWIRVLDESNTYIAKKIIFESGSITQRVSGQGVVVEMTGYLQDVPTQPGNEKNLWEA